MRPSLAPRTLAGAVSTLVVVACLATLPGSASADRFVGVGGGVAIPYKGQVGWTVLGEIGSHLWDSPYFLGSTEFEFRRQDASASGGGPDVPVDLYNLRLLGRFVFSPKTISPYFGGGGGLGAINTKATATDNSELGLSGSVIGLLGLHVPLAKGRIALYGETRFGFTWDLTGDFSHVRRKGFDGFTGVGGVRFRF
jgi:hypothetical protein